MNKFFNLPTAKICILTIILIVNNLFIINSSAQNIDSLKSIVREHENEDTFKVMLYERMAAYFADGVPDSALKYASYGYKIAQKIDYRKGKIACSIPILNARFHKNQIEAGIKFGNEILQEATKLNDSNQLIPLYNAIAGIYMRQFQFAKAMDLSKISLRLSEKSNIQDGFIWIQIGSCYSGLGKNSEALDCYLKSKNIFEKNGKKEGLAVSYSYVGYIYSIMQKKDISYDYNNRSKNLAADLNNQYLKFLINLNTSKIFKINNRFEEACQILSSTVHLSDSLGIYDIKALAEIELGNMLMAQKSIEIAISHFKSCLEDSANKNAADINAAAAAGLAKVYIEQKNIKVAINLLEKSYNIYSESQFIFGVLETSEQLFIAFKLKNDYENALKYSSIYYTIKDSINKLNINQNSSQSDFEVALNKKQEVIEKLQLEKQLSLQEHKKLEFYYWIAAAFVLLLVVIIVILFRTNYLEKKRRVSIQKREEALKIQAKELETLNHFKSKTFSIVSHDLRGPIGSISTTLALLNNKELSFEEFMDIIPEVNKQLNSISLLLDNLLKWAKGIMQGKFTANGENVNLYNVTVRNLALLADLIEGKSLKVKNNVPPRLTAFCDADHIDIIIRNILSNAIKYNEENGFIHISASIKNNTVQLIIADNGVGMTQEQLSKVFTSEINKTTYGTAGEKGTGIGLILCHDFVTANNGTISATSEVGKGATFSVSLPLAKSL